jgi:hypothetical protein
MKPHFVQSQDPITTFGEDMVALCGKTVHKAQLRYVFDSLDLPMRVDELMRQVNTLSSCKHCIQEKFDARYLYLVSSDVKEAESDAA